MRWGAQSRWLLGVGVVVGVGAAACGVALSGCGNASLGLFDGPDAQGGSVSGGACPARQPAPEILPHVSAAERTAAYWLARRGEAADEVVLSAAEVAAHNAAFEALAVAKPDDDPLTHYDLLAPENTRRLERDLKDRFDYLHERVADGRYVDAQGKPIDAAAFARPQTPSLIGSLHLAEADIPLRCGPVDAGLYAGPEVDLAFDRNSCSTIRKGELLRLVARWPGGMQLVRTTYALGFVAADARLSAGIDAGRARAALVTPAPITRRALYEKAFSYLDTPYGWGGKDGGRDCSRFLMDTFGAFGLRLPRPSGSQANAGSMTIDVSKVEAEDERLSLIDAADARGFVLLHFPGHIMLYLGRNAEGRPMAIHAFAEYLEACSPEQAQAAGRSETLRAVDRVQISDLSLGAGTSRRSFLERITKITVLGGTPGPALLGAVSRRPAAPIASEPERCTDSQEVAVFTSPRKPHPGKPLRVIVASSRDLGSTQIVLRGPGGATHVPALHRTGGPPFGYWAELASPAEGRWRALVGEGSRIDACAELTVYDEGDQRQANVGRVWQPRGKWTPAIDNLYGVWVEQLFDYPLDDRTWPNLQEILAARDNNLLYDHLGQEEESVLELRPDCADLPYFLRAYFSWKMRMPFAYRHCNRGFEGKAPYCDPDTHDPLVSVEAATEVKAFGEWARVSLANGVHSGSGRTDPALEHTDYYPIPIRRDAIRPGTIFADPYGHLFVIAQWVPQGIGSHGILVGADAQPDGTVGRRRFWPGSFLFTPDTREAGAGFKAFRPARYAGGRIRQYDNASIASLGLAPFSMEQYQGDKDSFYDRVEALINPRPLDPRSMLDVLTTALYEQVKRRVISVQNGEDYKQAHRAAIDMPNGHAIFETTGAWEDYSTPSRDMRLLIAIDSVIGFPDAVKRNPERFRETAATVDATVADLRSYLDTTLAEMDFSYVKSNGERQPLTVKDVVARAKDFELAYNPNDCVEIRWAAPEGSPERQSCRSFAPAHQRQKMLQYRPWFAERKRPPR